MKALRAACVVVAVLWLGVFAAILSGCAAPIAAGPSAQRNVYRAEGDFAAALPLAVAYDGLPDCVAGQAVACSTPLLRSRVNAAARAARASLATAQKLVRADSAPAQVAAAVSAAAQDVAAFTALARSLGQ